MASGNMFQAYERSRQNYEDKDLKTSDASLHPEEDSLLNQHEIIFETHHKSYKGHLEFIRILLAVIMSVTITVVTMNVFRPSPRVVCEEKDSGLPLMPIPELGPIRSVFEFDPVYYGPPTDKAADQAWADMIPTGRGFVSLERLEEAGDVPDTIKDMDTGGTGKFCVAVFHQLHCVNVLRHAYYHAMEGKTGLEHHVTHCLAYLRQSLRCAADISLEPYRVANNGVDGFFSNRQCRNYDAVYHWAERFRYTEEKSIDNHKTHDGSAVNGIHQDVTTHGGN